MIGGANVLNLIIEMAGIIFCATAFMQVLFAKLERRARLHFLLFYVSLTLLMGANIAGLLMRGRPGPGWRAALCVSNFTEFLMSALVTYIVTHYLLSVVDPQRKRRRTRILLGAILLLYAAALIVSQFTGLFYVLDENNVYHRSAAYPLAYLLIEGMFVIAYVLLFRRGKMLAKKERIAFGIYYLVPTVAMVLQIRYYGINFVIFSTFVAGFAMYVFIVSDQTVRYYQQQVENERLKTQIMLGQIQPHFLYNTLGAIKSTYYDDPVHAREAIDRFTVFLRHNMDSLTEDRPIPFEKELGYVKCYLELLQLRFGEELSVEYDLACTGFRLPTLTLQPLVENAVTYGARKTESGKGLITIRSGEYPDRYEVSVTDNGPGFVPNGLQVDGERFHIGIRNVRERLRHTVGGELRIESAPGKGTTATIILPKKP